MSNKFKVKKKLASIALALSLAVQPLSSFPMNVFAGTGKNGVMTAPRNYDVIEVAVGAFIGSKYTVNFSKPATAFKDGENASVLCMDGKIVQNPGIVYATGGKVATNTIIIADIRGMLNDLKSAFPSNDSYKAQIESVTTTDSPSIRFVSHASCPLKIVSNTTNSLNIYDGAHEYTLTFPDTCTFNGTDTITFSGTENLACNGDLNGSLTGNIFTTTGDVRLYSWATEDGGYFHIARGLILTIQLDPFVDQAVRDQVENACKSGATLEQKLKALYAGYSAMVKVWADLAEKETDTDKKAEYEAKQAKCNERATALKQVINCGVYAEKV